MNAALRGLAFTAQSISDRTMSCTVGHVFEQQLKLNREGSCACEGRKAPAISARANKARRQQVSKSKRAMFALIVEVRINAKSAWFYMLHELSRKMICLNKSKKEDQLIIKVGGNYKSLKAQNLISQVAQITNIIEVELCG